jgi:hypothetical protein
MYSLYVSSNSYFVTYVYSRFGDSQGPIFWCMNAIIYAFCAIPFFPSNVYEHSQEKLCKNKGAINSYMRTDHVNFTIMNKSCKHRDLCLTYQNILFCSNCIIE